MKKGLFIVLEGGDGSGKTTQTNLLQSYLTDLGATVIRTREPGGTIISEKIRDLILDPKHTEMDPVTEAYLYATSRAQHVRQLIIPSLEDGDVVLSERFVYSSYAYQGIARGLGLDLVRDINKSAIEGATPDITIYLDINPEFAMKRKTEQKELDRLELEGVSFQEKLRQGYLSLAKDESNNICVIDTMNKSIQDVFIDIKEIIDSMLM